MILHFYWLTSSEREQIETKQTQYFYRIAKKKNMKTK